MMRNWLFISACAALAGASFAGSAATRGSLESGGPTGVDQSAISQSGFPRTLSEFGFFDGGPDNPNASLIAYSVRNPLFSDYAHKVRFIHMPKGAKLEVAENGLVEFPVGTALIKSFGYVDKQGGMDTLETRVLLRRTDGWLALPYVWNEDRSDAALKVAGTRIAVDFTDPSGADQSISYAVPNKNQCKQCHSRDGELAPIGPVWQDMIFSRPEDQKRLAMGAAIPANLPAPSAKWDDPSASLNARAGSYLAANCAHCHSQTGSASNSGLFYGGQLGRNAASGFLKRPVAAGRASAGYDYVVAPGDPDQSILVHRMKSLDPGVAMPEIGRATVHQEGVALVEEWVKGLEHDRQ